MAGALSALAIGGPRAGWVLVSEASTRLRIPLLEGAPPTKHLDLVPQQVSTEHFAYDYAPAEATGIGFPCWVPAEVGTDPRPGAVRRFVLDELLRAYRAHVEEARV